MGPNGEQVKPRSTKVRLLRRTSPAERAQVQRGHVCIDTRGSMQPYTRKMPELQRKSYCIQWKVWEENRGHHNSATEQQGATEWTRDEGGNVGQQSSARHQAG
jgi:hypothetical protein